MRSARLALLIAAVLAAGPPAAGAQSDRLPTTLFEPAPEAVPARSAPDDDGGTPVLLAALLVAAASGAGYLTARPYGSSRSTRRS